MPCFEPLHGWRSRFSTKSGKYPVVFDKRMSNGIKVQVPCGQCIGCRLMYAFTWAVRLMYEKLAHDDAIMLTATYDDDHLPFGGTLHAEHPRRFINSLRRKLLREGKTIRYYYVGEYGDDFGRPHYHFLIFGYWPPDAVYWRTDKEHRHYKSETLEALWKNGITEFTSVTFQTAAYCARYVTKKVTGDNAEEHYSRVDMETGEIITLLPEFARMSLRPAIGHESFKEFGQHIMDWDTVVIDGKEYRPPRYFDKLWEEHDPEGFAKAKAERKRRGKKSPDNTPERLAVRQECARIRLDRKKRNLT